jgi:hypothetical protein
MALTLARDLQHQRKQTRWSQGEHIMAENKFENTGNFRRAALFQGSEIRNAGQIAGTIQNADQGARAELQALLQKLGDHLKEVPPEKVEDAEAVSASAEDLVKEAAKDKPNKSRLRLLGIALVDMAKTVGTAAPAAVSLAGKIVDLVEKISGGGGGPPSVNV